MYQKNNNYLKYLFSVSRETFARVARNSETKKENDVSIRQQ